jgi:hypothetical protein
LAAGAPSLFFSSFLAGSLISAAGAAGAAAGALAGSAAKAVTAKSPAIKVAIVFICISFIS